MTKDELKIKFLSMRSGLSVRSKNILEDLDIFSFDGFFKKYIEQNKRVDFKKVRNCGLKSEMELNSFIKELLANTQELAPKKPSFYYDIRLEYIFKALFNELTVRSRNVLSKGGADTFKGFYVQILNSDSDHEFLMRIRNCGRKSLTEILEFKQKVNNIIDNHLGVNLTQETEEPSVVMTQSFFTTIQFLLFEAQIFNKKEIHILRHFHCIENGFKQKTLAELGEDFKLTRERVRQISVKLIDKLKINIIKVAHSLGKEIDKYYNNYCFRIDDFIASQINNTEQTNFTSKFITYALCVSSVDKYTFISTNESKKKLNGFDGVFIENHINIDCGSLYKYITKFANTKRDEDVEIYLSELVKLFPKGERSSKDESFCNTTPIETENIKPVINLLIQQFISDDNKIEVTSESLVFQRNTKKLKYEYLVDILREYRRPLHYSDLEKECHNRGYFTENVQGNLINHPDVFGLKGPGTYGLIEWGGYFGSIGDVTETILREKRKPIDITELEDILCRELYISQDSIRQILFNYDIEKRFVKQKNNYVALKEWLNH